MSPGGCGLGLARETQPWSLLHRPTEQTWSPSPGVFSPGHRRASGRGLGPAQAPSSPAPEALLCSLPPVRFRPRPPLGTGTAECGRPDHLASPTLPETWRQSFRLHTLPSPCALEAPMPSEDTGWCCGQARGRAPAEDTGPQWMAQGAPSHCSPASWPCSEDSRLLGRRRGEGSTGRRLSHTYPSTGSREPAPRAPPRTPAGARLSFRCCALVHSAVCWAWRSGGGTRAGRGTGALGGTASMLVGAKARAAWPRPGEGGDGDSAGLSPAPRQAGGQWSPPPPHLATGRHPGHEMAQG